MSVLERLSTIRAEGIVLNFSSGISKKTSPPTQHSCAAMDRGNQGVNTEKNLFLSLYATKLAFIDILIERQFFFLEELSGPANPPAAKEILKN